MMTEHFTIDKVSWHTMTPGNTEPRERTVLRFHVIHKYLRQNNFLRRDLLSENPEIDDTFAISSSDVTEEGLAFIRAAYDRWLRKVDNGMDPRDVSVLDRALKRLREK
jgi:hypothetical protein